MTLLIHIIAAIASLAYTAYLYLAPSRFKLRVSYALIGLTLASGTYLVWNTRASLVTACTTGLLYLAAVCIGITAAQRKQARAVSPAKHQRS